MSELAAEKEMKGISKWLTEALSDTGKNIQESKFQCFVKIELFLIFFLILRFEVIVLELCAYVYI